MKHGTLTAYTNHACRCDACRTVMLRHQKEWRLDRHRGIERMVDADHIRAHVQQLLDQGMSFRGIALIAGYKSRNSLECALSRKRVTRKVHDRIMAVTVDADTRCFGYVDPTGSARRLQALMAIGWPSRILTTRLGMAEHGSVLDIANHNNATIRRATADNVRRVYDELWDKPGPSRISAQRAAKRGWVPPLAWDDDTIDDPAAVADLGEPDAPSPRGRLREHVVEDYLDTWDHHLGYLPAAATRLGLSEYALEQALRRSGLRVSRVAS